MQRCSQVTCRECSSSTSVGSSVTALQLGKVQCSNKSRCRAVLSTVLYLGQVQCSNQSRCRVVLSTELQLGLVQCSSNQSRCRFVRSTELQLGQVYCSNLSKCRAVVSTEFQLGQAQCRKQSRCGVVPSSVQCTRVHEELLSSLNLQLSSKYLTHLHDGLTRANGGGTSQRVVSQVSTQPSGWKTNFRASLPSITPAYPIPTPYFSPSLASADPHLSTRLLQYNSV